MEKINVKKNNYYFSDAARVKDLFDGKEFLKSSQVTIHLVKNDPSENAKRKKSNDSPKIAPVVDLTEIDEETDGERELHKLERELKEMQRKVDEAKANNKATTRENNRNMSEISRLRITGEILKIVNLTILMLTFSYFHIKRVM